MSEASSVSAARTVDILLAMAPERDRRALTALFALDRKLAEIFASTTEPMIGQIRFAWWREALSRLDDAPPPAEPLLRELHAVLPGSGVTGRALAAMIDGWEVLIGAEPDTDALVSYAEARGGGLFTAATKILGRDHPPAREAGKGWALAELTAAGPFCNASCRDLARAALAAGFAQRWPKTVRPLGVMALLARFDLDHRAEPLRYFARLFRFRLTGR